jgi:DNA primase
MDVERLTFPEAVEFLANRVGMAMPEEVNDAEMMRVRAKRERLSEACKLAARFYMETLLGEAAARDERISSAAASRAIPSGVSASVLRPRNGKRSKISSAKRDIRSEELVEAGLLVKNDQSGRTYDAYRGRLIFPILSASGRVIGFGARVLNNEEKPKYINTGDTLLYNKRNNLYGLNQQKSGKLSDLVIVEGYTDVIGLYEAGVTNAVASLGTALTTQQARLLKRYVSTVYIAYDGDAAGQNATIRGLDILTTEGLSVRVIVFPDEQDPDEFVREHGKEAFDVLKENALSLNAFKLESMARAYDLSKENEREQYAMSACKFIATLTPVERERYYQQLSKKTGYSIETLKAQGATTRRDGMQPSSANVPLKKPEQRVRTAPVDNERTRAESALLCMMLRSKEAAMLVSDCGCDKPFGDEATRAFARALTSAYERGETPNIPLLIANMEKEHAERITAALREETECSEPEKAARDCIRRIEKCDLLAEMEEIKAQLAEPSLSADERAKKLREMQKLNLRMRGL